MPKFPEIDVQLTGEDGNAFAVLGKVSKALRRAGHGEAATDCPTCGHPIARTHDELWLNYETFGVRPIDEYTRRVIQ